MINLNRNIRNETIYCLIKMKQTKQEMIIKDLYLRNSMNNFINNLDNQLDDVNINNEK